MMRFHFIRILRAAVFSICVSCPVAANASWLVTPGPTFFVTSSPGYVLSMDFKFTDDAFSNPNLFQLLEIITIDWGDGSSASKMFIESSGGPYPSLAMNFSHVYGTPGKFLVSGQSEAIYYYYTDSTMTNVSEFFEYENVSGVVAISRPPTPMIPEPETYALLLAGLGLLGFVARRRKLSVSK